MTVPGETPPASHADSFSKEGLFKADVSTLKDTQLVAHLDVPLRENQNVLWCGTLQLTWNKTIDLVGEKLHFANQPPVVDLLNQEDFTDADLDPPSYVALADFERNNVEDEIRAALEKTFHGAASPELIPPRPAHFGPDDFVAYAYLYKNLSFPQPFEDNPPIDFGKSQVKAFGFMTNLNRLPDGMIEQVAIYDYKSRDNFIIKLKTKSPDDELILAKINPVSTLQATLDNVLRRMAKNTPMTPVTGDTLAVPKFNFDLRGDFPALEGLILEPSPIAHVKKLKMESVRQLVRFQLNEKGAILKSEAEITMRATMVFVRPEPHVMVFDKPFLILMKRTNSEHPYFALWVGNASLLVGTTPK
jgi:hypothetical protein